MASSSNSSLEDFAASLGSDRIVPVIVGNATFHVPKSILRSISLAFRIELEVHHGIQALQDFPDAWKVLLYWKIKGEFPSEKIHDQKLLVECWLIGHEFRIAEFQDNVMLYLIHHFETELAEFDVIKTAFRKMGPASKLRHLMAEELLELRDDGSVLNKDVDEVDGIAGFASALMDAYDRQKCNNGGFYPRLRINGNKRERWKDFMVGEGPKQHWVYTKKKEPS